MQTGEEVNHNDARVDITPHAGDYLNLVPQLQQKTWNQRFVPTEEGGGAAQEVSYRAAQIHWSMLGGCTVVACASVSIPRLWTRVHIPLSLELGGKGFEGPLAHPSITPGRTDCDSNLTN